MSIKYDFSGKVVLITGSSSGIGAATAVLFSESGAVVVVTGRNRQKIQEVAKHCLEVSPNKSKALEVVADVTIETDMTRLVNETIKHFGRLDVLVNNAGGGSMASIYDQNYYKSYLKTIEMNLNSYVFMTHISVEHLAKTKGNIINISGIGSKQVNLNLSAHCMTRSAINIFTKCMATELAPKAIRVNVINPGPVLTDFTTSMGHSQELSDKISNNWSKLLPIGRCGWPKDIADSILYLASDHAAFITGSNLVTDGGAMAMAVKLN